MRRLAAVVLIVLSADPAAASVRDAAPSTGATDEVVASVDATAPTVEAAQPGPHERKKVHLKKGELTLAVARLAARFLDRPMGSETVRVVDGRAYAFCVEEHYHAPGSGLRPEGWHTGVTVYGFE